MAEKPKNLPIQFGKITNPTSEDLNFLYDSAPYTLKSGETEERWPAHLAKHAAKKLADKNIMTNNPEEHRVLMGAYLENSEIGVIAKRLGIDLTKIRKEAMTKEKAKSRVINLETQMLEMKQEIKEMKEENKVNEAKEKADKKAEETKVKKEKEEANAGAKADAEAKKKEEKEAERLEKADKAKEDKKVKESKENKGK